MVRSCCGNSPLPEEHQWRGLHRQPCQSGVDVPLSAQRVTDPKAIANHVLASIPPAQYRRLRAQLETARLEFGQVLYEPGEPIRFVYFPSNCLISLLTEVGKGRTLEVGMVGNEGMAGMPFILGIGVSGVQALVQGEGDALRMASDRFRIEFNRNPPLQQALFRYTHALMAQISQTAACNRFHSGGARLARWLLMTRDRVDCDEFPLTHEFLAHMLGLRRVGITQAANSLRRRKLIRYHRGVIHILDAKGLEASSCSCYRVVKDVYERAQVPPKDRS
jgi:CRP-like cAMP-binding protein